MKLNVHEWMTVCPHTDSSSLQETCRPNIINAHKHIHMLQNDKFARPGKLTSTCTKLSFVTWIVLVCGENQMKLFFFIES